MDCFFCGRIKDGIIEANDVPNREEAETCSPIKKTRALALVFWLLMGDILSPRDEIFFFLFDPLDIILMSKNDQGR